MPSTYALIVAAGRGTRFGGELPKQYLGLGGGTVLRRAVAAFATHPRVAGVLVTIRPEDQGHYQHAIAGLAVLPPVLGGPERQDSVRLGLEALAAHSPDRVLIHDGARPFPDAALITRIIDGLDRASAAIPALPLGDTIKRVEDGLIRATVDRSQLWRAQTPQMFRYELLRRGLEKKHAATDEAEAVESTGYNAPRLVQGENTNIKVTFAEDLKIAALILQLHGRINF